MNIWRPDWQQHAVCRGMNTELFMPKRGDHHGVKKAIAICNTCPVIQQCRDYGFQLEEEGLVFGVFGGLTQSHRDKALTSERRTGQRSPARTAPTPGLNATGLNANHEQRAS